MTNTLGVITHPSVFTKDGECIAFNMAALHVLEIKELEDKEAEVLNAYEIALNKAGWG